MKLIQTLTNGNLTLNKTARIFETTPQKGFEALFKPSYEVSTNSGGVDIAWNFQSFALLEDAQQYAFQFIMPKGMICKIVS
jgi:hypothetical protein